MDISFSKKERITLSAMLIPGERAVGYAKQRRLSGAILCPNVMVATNKRVIILNRWYLGLKSDITVIRYENIASFRITHGIIFSSIKIRLKGTKELGTIFDDGREEGEIKGLTRDGACSVGSALNTLMHNLAVEESMVSMRDMGQRGEGWVHQKATSMIEGMGEPILGMPDGSGPGITAL